MLDVVAQNQLQLLFALADYVLKELICVVRDLLEDLDLVLLETWATEPRS